jgi:hypothetical protein
MTSFNNRDQVVHSNISATPAAFTLRGGRYAIEIVATWSAGTATLQRLAADGSTYVTIITAFSANGTAISDLPEGTYQWLIGGSPTAVYAEIVSIAVPIF